ncbi:MULTISPECIES: autotransporter outer membrane beta-barrel domain-containing protein [unclassified Bradyrhizobium]|uniref:autotransporter family protein n=1 Tax=unclassified Bradyrhizobium TaxID=2631580 RepID=UPI001BA81669|nr:MULTISPECIES: autotransporter outer membrane beta-barrel domain-containing protein [unclassified Bradyrhizobium]
MSASVAALSALMPRSAAAQSWTGATGNDWTVGSNWTGGTAPAGGAVAVDKTSNIVLGVAAGATGTTGNFKFGGVTAGVDANLTIQNGATLTTTGNSLSIGNTNGTTSTVTVTGAGSQWIINGILNITAVGTNTLNIENGATVVAAGRLVVTSPGGTGTGTLNVSNATLVERGFGISILNAGGQANYDNAVIRAAANTAALTSGTAAQNNIAAGGLTIDSNGFLVIASVGFSGVGGLTKTGNGIFRFGGAGNSYTGDTVIEQGTLQLGSAAGSGNVLASSSRVVDNAIFDLSLTPDTNAHIQSLAGSSAGTVTLGTKDLILTNAHDSFAGTISGTGGLQLTGGTQALSGVQAYTGATTITSGTLALTDAGSIAASSQVIANGTFSIAGLSGAGTSIQRLSGSGGVDLGAKTLTITAAKDTFSGIIGGTGGLTLSGGSETLSGANTYNGVTTITAGTLALTGAGSISNSRVVTHAAFDISGLAGTGTSIQSLAGSGSVALGAKTLTLTNANDTFAGAIGGTGGLTFAGGTETLSGTNSYSGATTVNGGTLRAGAVNAFSAASAVTAGAGTTIDLNGFNQTIGGFSNAGTLQFGTTPGTTLTVAGNYAGNGGTLLFNTVLGGDGSATDRLVAGSTSGSSTVRINNAGGGGAQTGDGIKLIDVTGASNGIFTLAGNYSLQGQQAIVAGAYAYTLQKNGVATPTDGDWYLRSTLVPSSDPAAPTPLYQPGVPLYENYAQVLLGMNAPPSMQERVGNRYWGGGGPSEAMARMGVTPAAQADSSWTQSAFWGRVEGGQSSLRPSNITGSTANSDDFKAQAGLDGLALENSYGRLIVGLTLQYGLTTAYVNSFFGNGRIRAEGIGVGATATWYGDNGVYLDGQMQTMFYRGDLTSDLVGSMAHGNEGLGYAFSVEGGKRITIGNGFSLTPQAQLAYSKVEFDGFTDRFGALVSLGNADSLLGRVGLSLNHQKSWSDGARSDLYAIGNLHYEFLDGSNVDVAGTSFASANDRLWGSVGGGGSYSWANGRYTLFGEATYRASLQDAGNNHSYKSTAGLRVVW